MVGAVPDDGSLFVFAVLAVAVAVLAAYAVSIALFGRPAVQRLDNEPGTVLLGRFPIEAFHWAARGIGRALVRTGVSPDALTVISVVLAALSVPLSATGHFEAAGALFAAGSIFDALDGIVARSRGAASDAGEMLDATVDRYADALGFVGLALFYRDSNWRLAIVITALVGSMMVSYVRARAEALGVSLAPGLMRRPERIAYLSLALLLGPVVSWIFAPSDPTRPATLVVVAAIGLLSNLAALRLLREARARLRGASASRRNA
jgi:CDP-diacylglycerol--glycerol-3-phosphate 3-phosphatidyltransferase